jgi:hypothetical protein
LCLVDSGRPVKKPSLLFTFSSSNTIDCLLGGK